MTQHFTPDKYIRKDERSKTSKLSEKQETPTTNQPEPVISCVLNFNPRPNDKIWAYLVNPQRKIPFETLEEISNRLGELYGVDILIAEYWWNQFHVYLTEAVSWRDVEKYTLQVLNEFDS